jgi:hypothetical protein
VSSQQQLFNGQQLTPPDLIDRIARALPEELRADYYRELSHCRALPESDEMLRILRAMQFLTVLIEQAPGQVAIEREQLAEVLERAIEAIQTTHQASTRYQKQLEARLAKLPEEVAKGINAEAIAARLSESLRQQFQETGLPAIAEAMSVQATTLRNTTKTLSVVVSEFAHPQNGAAPRVNEALSRMKANVENAANHVRVQMNGLGKELWKSIAILCSGLLVLGFLAGMLYQQWADDAPAKPQQSPPSSSQTAPLPPSHPTAQPNHKRSLQPSSPSPAQ